MLQEKKSWGLGMRLGKLTSDQASKQYKSIHPQAILRAAPLGAPVPLGGVWREERPHVLHHLHLLLLSSPVLCGEL